MSGVATTGLSPFVMPSLGADMDEGRVVEWLVQPGERVERGQIVVVVETEKADIEVEVFEAAVVEELLVEPGELVAVGTPIARLRVETWRPGSQAPLPRTAPVSGDAGEASAQATETRPSDDRPAVAAPPLHSPLLRHLAERLDVEPTRVRGTGPAGRVGRDDIEAAARPGPPRVTPRARRLMRERGLDASDLAGSRLAVVTGDDVPMSPRRRGTVGPAAPTGPEARQRAIRRHIAELMERSWREIPHFHVERRLDMSQVVGRLTVVNEGRGPAERIVPGAVLLCAAAAAAAATPESNGWWLDGAFEPADGVELGVVVSLRRGGVIVPTIPDSQLLAPDEMMQRLDEVVRRARDGRLRSSDTGTASITVTSLGDRGADRVFGVIHPPQVALVGFGALRDEVWAAASGPEVRPTVAATFTGDHRAMDGQTGSRYLSHLQRWLDHEFPGRIEVS